MKLDMALSETEARELVDKHGLAFFRGEKTPFGESVDTITAVCLRKKARQITSDLKLVGKPEFMIAAKFLENTGDGENKPKHFGGHEIMLEMVEEDLED